MNPIPHIISKVTRQPWVITGEKLSAIMDALDARIAGDFKAMDYDAPERDNERAEYREFQIGGKTVAVIPVHGILGKHLSSMETACGGCSLDTLQNQLQAAGSSPRINQILLDVNSPGGTVTGTPETAAMIREARAAKPVWAFTDSEACSGGMWLASQCDRVYATESATLGSVGVRMVLLDYTRKLEEEGVKVNAISSGKYKLLGAPFRALSEEERDMLQTESDRIHQQFQKAIQAVRAVETAHLQGQVFRGEESAGIGLIDGVVNSLGDVMDMLAS
jgi:signal peptide peptidase SppA